MAEDGIIDAGCKFADFNPDAIIMDISMPNLDGYKSIKYMLSGQECHVDGMPHILVVSGYLGEAKDDLDQMGVRYLVSQLVVKTCWRK